jgi:hypothetical protein
VKGELADTTLFGETILGERPMDRVDDLIAVVQILRDGAKSSLTLSIFSGEDQMAICERRNDRPAALARSVSEGWRAERSREECRRLVAGRRSRMSHCGQRSTSAASLLWRVIRQQRTLGAGRSRLTGGDGCKGTARKESCDKHQVKRKQSSGSAGSAIRTLAEYALKPSSASFGLTKSFQPAGADR